MIGPIVNFLAIIIGGALGLADQTRHQRKVQGHHHAGHTLERVVPGRRDVTRWPAGQGGRAFVVHYQYGAGGHLWRMAPHRTAPGEARPVRPS